MCTHAHEHILQPALCGGMVVVCGVDFMNWSMKGVCVCVCVCVVCGVQYCVAAVCGII